MTHLENFLDCVKGLPNDLERNFQLMRAIDKKAEELKVQLFREEQEALTLANAGKGPDGMLQGPDLARLQSIRAKQKELYNLSHEKIAIAEQSKELIESFATRLDDDLGKFEEDCKVPLADVDIPRGRLLKRSKSTNAFQSDGEDDYANGDSRHNHQMQDDAEESSSGGSSPNPYEDDGHKYGEHPSAGGVGVGVGGMDHDMMAPQQQQQGGQVALDENGDPQPLYCYCQQVSFGEMVGCDGEHCRFEWFHYACVGLKRPPKGKWYCEDCRRTLGR